MSNYLDAIRDLGHEIEKSKAIISRTGYYSQYLTIKSLPILDVGRNSKQSLSTLAEKALSMKSRRVMQLLGIMSLVYVGTSQIVSTIRTDNNTSQDQSRNFTILEFSTDTLESKSNENTVSSFMISGDEVSLTYLGENQSTSIFLTPQALPLLLTLFVFISLFVLGLPRYLKKQKYKKYMYPLIVETIRNERVLENLYRDLGVAIDKLPMT